MMGRRKVPWASGQKIHYTIHTSLFGTTYIALNFRGDKFSKNHQQIENLQVNSSYQQLYVLPVHHLVFVS